MLQHKGELIAFCTTLSWSIGIFPFTEAARRLGPNAVNHFRLLMAVVLLTLLAVLLVPVSFNGLFTQPLGEHWLWFGLSGIIGLALGDYFSFTSFAIMGTRIGSIFSTLSPAATLLFGTLLVGEHINVIGVAGIIITVAGMIWLSLSRSETAGIQDTGHGNVGKGIIFGVLSALCQGVGVVLANKGFTYAYNGGTVPALHATWLRMTCATAFIYLFSFLTGRLSHVYRPVIENRKKGNWFALAGTVFGPVVGVSFSMYAIALLKDKPSVAQTIFSLVPIFAMPLALIFYKEKISWKAVLGAFTAVAGVVILIQRDEIMMLLTN